MNSKQLFFISLIVISLAMGFNWIKHRPKQKMSKDRIVRTAVKYEDLNLKDTNEAPVVSESFDDELYKMDLDDDYLKPHITKNEPFDSAEAAVSSDSELSSRIEKVFTIDDDIIKSFQSLKHNPFSQSPYVKLLEKNREKEIEQQKQLEEQKRLDATRRIKPFKVLNAKFTATIVAGKQIVAILDSRLYKVGDSFQEMKVIEIKEEVLKLEAEDSFYLIPKLGVKITINENGTYSINDEFRKK